jgi:Domain of unknown function (DUF5911)
MKQMPKFSERMNSARRPVAFSPINRHGVIGDRRTGVLVAADGTLNWFCVPNFDGTPIFGTLLDPVKGGFCRFGPERAYLGRQRYLRETAAVVTTWNEQTEDSTLELTDIMAWPCNKRETAIREARVVIRRLRAAGAKKICFEICPRWGYTAWPEEIRPTPEGVIFRFGKGCLEVWTSFPLAIWGRRGTGSARCFEQ